MSCSITAIPCENGHYIAQYTQNGKVFQQIGEASTVEIWYTINGYTQPHFALARVLQVLPQESELFLKVQYYKRTDTSLELTEEMGTVPIESVNRIFPR